MIVKCVCCDAENDALKSGAYCDSCGKKLPSTALLKPRRTLGGDMPAQPGEVVPVPRKSKQTSEALIGVTVVYLAAGGLFLILAPLWYQKDIPEHFAPYVLTWTVLPTMVLGALVVLARFSPQPAVLLGFALAAVWVGATFLVSPRLASGWLLVDAVLAVMLLWAGWVYWRKDKRAPGG